MDQLWEALKQLFVALGNLLAAQQGWILTALLFAVWVAWWLWGVNWPKTWAALAQGAWAPVALLVLVIALVWSQIAPSPCDCLGFVTVSNFWWQLGYLGMLVAIALFCGWLQGYFGWTPAEVNLEPPAPAHGHDHEHGHGHH